MIYTVVQLPRDPAGWPKTLFFYSPGRPEPTFKFTRASKARHWIGHGFYAMTRAEVEAWVEAGAKPLPGKGNGAPKTPDEDQLAIVKAKVADTRAKGLKKLWVTPAMIDALIRLAEKDESE